MEARDRTVQSLRARVDGLVEQLAQAQEEAEQVRSDAEQRVERLEEACAVCPRPSPPSASWGPPGWE